MSAHVAHRLLQLGHAELALEQRQVELDRHERLARSVVQLARESANPFLDDVEPLVRHLLQLGAMVQHEGVQPRVGDRHRRAVAERRGKVEEARFERHRTVAAIGEHDPDELRLKEQRQPQQQIRRALGRAQDRPFRWAGLDHVRTGFVRRV